MNPVNPSNGNGHDPAAIKPVRYAVGPQALPPKNCIRRPMKENKNARTKSICARPFPHLKMPPLLPHMLVIPIMDATKVMGVKIKVLKPAINQPNECDAAATTANTQAIV